MKKIHMFAALLAMLLPTMSAWGDNHTYYAKLTVSKASSSTGSGTVYVGKSQSSANSTFNDPATNPSVDNDGSNASVGFYVSAKPSFGSKFSGWYENAAGTGTAKSTVEQNYNYPIDAAASEDNSSKRVSKTLYAKFDSNTESYTLTLNKPEGLASYTVTAPSGFPTDLSQGGSAAVYNGDQYTFRYNLSSDEYDFINWTVNGEQKTDNPVSVTISGNTTVVLTLKKKVTYTATCQGSAGGTYRANTTTVSGSDQTLSNFGSITVSLSNPVANPGYAFYGWYKLYSNGVKEYLSYYTSVSTGEMKENITIGAEFREVQDCTINFIAPAEGKITYAISGGNSGEVDDTDKNETVPAGADVTLTATSDYGSRRAKWYTKDDSGEKVYFSIDKSLTRTFASSVVVGVDFIPVNEKIVNAIEAAQSSSSHEAILAADAEIVLDTSIEIPSDITIDLDGHTLYVDGTLTVNGTLTGGTVSKCLKVVKQTGADGMVPVNPYGSVKYWKTEKAVASTASVTGWSGALGTHLTIMRGDGVAVRGAITSAAKLVKCTFDGAVAVNHVTAIGAASDTADISENLSYILLADVTINGPVVAEGSNGQYSRIRNSATIDCAGWACTMGNKQISSSTSSKVLNALTFTYSSTYWQNGGATFYNCPSISIRPVKNTPTFHLYDSGSSRLEFTQSDGGTAKCKFYSGKFDTDLSGNGPTWINKEDGGTQIYGGGFLKKPDKKWIEATKQSTHTFSQHSDGYWYLDINQDPNVASISGTKYLTIEEALDYLDDNSSATITLLKDVQLASPYTLEAGKSLVIELNGCHIDAPNGFVKNYGSLSIRDNNNSLAVCGVTAGSGSNIIENYDNGTADICYGLYNGNFAVNGGTFTTHHGKFIGSVANNGGTVNLKGGVFSSDVSPLMNEGYHAFSYGGWYYAGRFPKPEEGSSSIASFARVLTAMPTTDKTLYLAKKTYSLASCSSVDEWKRVAELKAAYVLYDDEFNFDILVGFDQDIAANTVQATVNTKLGPQSDYFPAMNAGVLERIFSPRITQNPISYKRFIYDNGEGNYDTMEAGVSAVNNANAGTACVLAMDLWKYHNKTTKYSYLTILALPYVFGAGNNVAMIRPATGAATFYATLDDAMDAVANGGTVMLSNDNTAPLKLEKAGTYTFDTMGFKHSGGVELGEGLSIKSETPAVSSVATLIPDAVATTYVVVEESAATAVDAPTAVAGLVYDGTEKTGVASDTGYTLSGNTATAAGSYTATATLEEGYVWSDESSDAKTITWSIGKTTLTATAENKSIIRGQTVQYTIAYSGFVNGEDVAALTAAPTASCDYNPADFSTTATSYPIALTGGSSANYDITLVNGTLTVAPSEARIEQGEETTYVTSISDVVAAAQDGAAVSVTLVTSDPVSVSGMAAGKTLTVTPADGITANVTVTPATGAFIETATEGATTTYESKKITVKMAAPQASVEVTKIENGEENAVTDASVKSAAVAQLMGNNDVPRTDNTDKLAVLDVITVMPTKIVLDENGKIKSATFDVMPALNAGQSLGEGQKLKFRLPVDAAATQLASIVYHNGAQFGIYPVQTYNEEKFIEIASDAFSPYGYELLDGETANPIAAIGTTGYASLAAAVAAVPTDGTETTITMLAGETIAADAGITIVAGKNIVLDLNGQTVQMAAASADERWLIKNEGTLTVKDSAENGKLLMSATGQASTAVRKSTIKNMGALTLESGTIELTYSGTTKEEPTAILNDASDRATSLTVKGGTVINSANRGMGVYLAVNDANATVFDVQGGRVEGYGAAVRYYFDDRNLTDAKLTFNMSNGTIHGRGMYGIQGMSTSSKDWSSISFDISGGTISCAGLLDRKHVISPLQGTVSISGGTFAGDVYIYGHALEITDGDFAGNVTLYRTKESLVSASVSGGQFSSGLTIAETTNESTTNPYYGTKFITGGVYGTAPAARNVVDGYVVVDNTDAGTQDDYPKAIGGAVASITVESETTYFATIADAIAAADAANVDEITILDSSITTSPDADWKVVGNKLVKKSYVAQVITDGGATTNEFDSLEAAFTAANAAGTATIKMLENLGSTDYTIVQDNPRLYAIDAALTNVSVTVAKTSNITLDLNGKRISAVDNTGAGFSFIDNKGTFTVVDSTADASGNAAGVLCYGSLTPDGSYGYGNYTINNSGTVTVESGTVMNNIRYTRMGTTPNNFAHGASYPINSSASGADSWVYVNGGVVYNWATAAIRAFGNDSYTAYVVVSGGQVAGYPAIWLQNPNSDPSSAAKIDLQINGGQISHTSASGVADAIMSSTDGAMLDNVTITINGGTIDGYVDVGDDELESSETVTITGGTFLTENAIACYAANDAEIGKIQISGGQFATQVPEKYCANGYIPTDADPVTGKYTVMEGAYVAQIGTTKYTSLEAAFAAANAAGTATIKMLEDVDVTNVAYVVSAGKTITLDLNGKTVKGTDDTNTGFAFITNNGTFTLDDTSENHDGELVYGTQTPDMRPSPGYGSYTIENTGTLNIVAGTVRQTTRGPACYAVDNSSRTSDAVFNMQGGLMTSPGTVMRAYGLSNTYENEINVSGGSIAATGAAALMVQPGSSAPKVTLNVTGGSMSGRDYAFLDVNYGTSLDNITYNIQGGTFTGEIFTYGVTTEISGGTFNGPVTEKAGDLTISGGTFNDTVEAYGGGTVQISNGTFNGTVVADDNGTALISGGQFASRVPEEYCAEGYIPTDLDPVTGKYTVVEGTYVAQIVRGGEVVAKYTSFDAALAIAQSGDTVQLLADVTGVTTTYDIDKTVTIDGQGQYAIVAGANTTPRSVVDAWGGSRVMFDMTRSTANVTFKDITLDNGEGHYYSFLARVKNGTTTLENASILHGAEADSSGADGVGYGAAVQVDGGTVLVTGDFYADTHGAPLEVGETGDRAAGIFPFTAFLYQDGGIHFDDGVNASIGQDLLLVGMVGAMDVASDADRQMVQEMLDEMNVPDGYYPYTLKVGDDSLTSFTGASPLGWNDIIDYGKDIMDVSSSLGIEMDKTTTPVEVGLLGDTVLPETFTFEDANLTVNGNGYALSGTIEYTDNAGLIEDIVLGTKGTPLVIDLTDTTKPVVIGSGISVTNVVVKMTPEQATAGTPVIIWDAEHGVDAPENEEGVTVQLVDDQGAPTGETAELIWDDEMGMAYIGPCEARLTGPTHAEPVYTTLAHAIELAAQTGDTVTLLMNVANVSGTYEISKQNLFIDGAGYTVAAAPVSTHRNLFEAWGGSKNMFKLQTGSITFRNITLDGDATHAYTFLISADNSGVTLTTENVRLVNGGEQSVDSDGVTLTPGNGYGAAIHLNNGANIVVSNGFYACTGGRTAGCFPFTAILVDEGGADVKFELTGNPNDPANVDIGDDLLLVGMLGDLINDYGLDAVQGMLSEMQVPTRFIPYTLTLADGSAYAFTGASPRRWNDIIDYGKDIMDVATANGFSGLDKDTTPVEVGLATDTILPAGADGDGYDFLYEDSNFSINGNGNALSGTIKFTDDADGGLMRDIELGTETNPLTLDLRSTDNPVVLGEDVVVQHVDVLMTEDQATLGKIVFEWDSGETPPDDEQGVEVTVVDGSGNPTGETKGLVWDEEYGVAYIGPVEARLTGTTHETPVYTSLANALDIAKDNDKVELLTNAVLSAVQGVGSDVTLDLAGYKVSVNGEKGLMVTNATLVIADTSAATNGTICAADGASPTSLIESGDGGVANIPTGIFAAASGGTVLATTGTGTIAVSGGYFSVEVLTEYCASGYAPMNAPTGAPQPYTVGETVPEFRYPIDGSVGVSVERTWLATYLSDIYSDPTKPVFANVTNDLVQALSENGANDMPRWESYVLGLNPTDVTARLRLTATSKDAATVTIIGLIDMTKFPKPDGTTITFRLAEVNLDGTKKVDLVTDSDEPSFDVLLEDVVGKELAIFADISVEGVAK